MRFLETTSVQYLNIKAFICLPPLMYYNFDCLLFLSYERF